MELYEITEKVGSDPCVVLECEVTNNPSVSANLSSVIKKFDTKAEADKYCNDITTTLIEKLLNTRCVILKITGMAPDTSMYLSTAGIGLLPGGSAKGVIFTGSGLIGGSLTHFILAMGTNNSGYVYWELVTI